jgi:hypothetical protein
MRDEWRRVLIVNISAVVFEIAVQTSENIVPRRVLADLVWDCTGRSRPIDSRPCLALFRFSRRRATGLDRFYLPLITDFCGRILVRRLLHLTVNEVSIITASDTGAAKTLHASSLRYAEELAMRFWTPQSTSHVGEFRLGHQGLAEALPSEPWRVCRTTLPVYIRGSSTDCALADAEACGTVWKNHERVHSPNQSMKPTAHCDTTSECLPRNPAVAYLFLVRPSGR